MTDLDEVFAAIDRQEPGENPATMDTILALMEAATERPGGLEALAARYGARDGAELLRPLTFLLARGLSRNATPAGAAIALALIDPWRCRDDTARSNLVTALHLAAMHGMLPALAPPGLTDFLVECLRGTPALVDAAVPAVASVLAARVRFSDGERAQLRLALEAVRDEHADWVAAAMRGLAAEEA